ncbi:hypothetical protein P152DRAFT_446008 [Eremomyces bilateralis CBS 781.70]|uniref:Uncharacterized protein n=1 Tax=Eremomyces bilateralis CBS 781.70 TaxID=1392243 RepID=A0A6G1GE85_9PEZI|nr:uncharacterized protein P152DRAFT_446008 [Eremomyces bilateralis CBS 781.70]KAF1816342.1 hypothetical protein P152DRAFT_446008 [Eremomyces bilateralis CBS 781.70]
MNFHVGVPLLVSVTALEKWRSAKSTQDIVKVHHRGVPFETAILWADLKEGDNDSITASKLLARDMMIACQHSAITDFRGFTRGTLVSLHAKVSHSCIRPMDRVNNPGWGPVFSGSVARHITGQVEQAEILVALYAPRSRAHALSNGDGLTTKWSS